MSTALKTITGEELMNMELPSTRMIVHRLLPQGLHILAGAPKTGKSWLTLWLCLQISKGEPVWELPTEKEVFSTSAWRIATVAFKSGCLV